LIGNIIAITYLEIILPFRFTPNFEFTGYQGLVALLFLLLLPCILQQNILEKTTIMDFRSSGNTCNWVAFFLLD
jgi:hypothetical protein